MTPKEHDKHLVYISHLSHISSFALGLTVLDLQMLLLDALEYLQTSKGILSTIK